MHFFIIDGILKQRKYGDDKNYWPSGPTSAVVTVPEVPEFQGRHKWILPRYRGYHESQAMSISMPESERGALTWILQGSYLMVINSITIATHVVKGAREAFSNAY